MYNLVHCSPSTPISSHFPPLYLHLISHLSYLFTIVLSGVLQTILRAFIFKEFPLDFVLFLIGGLIMFQGLVLKLVA